MGTDMVVMMLALVVCTLAPFVYLIWFAMTRLDSLRRDPTHPCTREGHSDVGLSRGKGLR